MQSATVESVLVAKARELCEALLNEGEFQSLRKRIDEFLADDDARDLYQALSEKGEYLQHKQMQGVELNDVEVAEFEQQRERFFSNPVARGFMDAQQSMHKMQETVSQYVGKTFELGRVPEPADFGGGCGPTCGCGS